MPPDDAERPLLRSFADCDDAERAGYSQSSLLPILQRGIGYLQMSGGIVDGG